MTCVIVTFRDQGTEDIFNGVSSKAARKCCPSLLWPVARRKMDQINSVSDVEHLKIPPGNRLKKLSGNRQGQWSIRINEQYRICFGWRDGDAYEVEVTDYH